MKPKTRAKRVMSFNIDKENLDDLEIICRAKKQSKSEIMDALLAGYVKKNAKICDSYKKMLQEL